MKVMVGEMKVDSEGTPYTTNCFTYEENKENLGKDLDIEVDGWSIKIEQGVEGEEITFSGVGKIFKIKRRQDNKALISLVADKKQLRSITKNIPDLDITSMPTTIIYPSALALSKRLLGSDGSAAIRIVQDKFCQQLIKKFGKPIVSTSANISGIDSPRKLSEISEERVENVSDYFVEGEEVKVKVLEVDRQGKIRLTMKGLED